MKDYFAKAISASAIILFFVLFLIPVALILENVSFSALLDVIGSAYYQRIMGFSLFQAFVSVIFSLFFGIPLAWIMANLNFKGKKIIQSMYYIPFIIPSILAVLGFVIFFGNQGILAKLPNREIHILYRFRAVIIAHVFFNFPIVVSEVSDALHNLNNDIEDQARLSGANEFTVFTKVTFPRIIPSILSAGTLIFLLCFTSFSIILVLGGKPAFTTAEVEIFRLVKISTDIPKACSLSLFSIAVSYIVICLNSHIEKSKYYNEPNLSGSKPQKRIPKWLKYLCIICVLCSVFFILSPILSIIARSFVHTATRTSTASFSLKSFKNIEFKCISNTLVISLVSSLLSVFLAIGLCKTKKNFFKNLAMLPMAVSSVIVGLSLFVVSFYLKFIPTILLIVFSHAVINLPFAFKTIYPAYKNIPIQHIEWAKLCGCSSYNYFRYIELPEMRNFIISAYLFCFALSCGELNSSLILGNSNIQTIPTAMMHSISSYNYQGACALGTILLLLSFAVFSIGNKLKH